jgi:hypothetical protein
MVFSLFQAIDPTSQQANEHNRLASDENNHLKAVGKMTGFCSDAGERGNDLLLCIIVMTYWEPLLC